MINVGIFCLSVHSWRYVLLTPQQWCQYRCLPSAVKGSAVTGLWLDLSRWFYANRWPYPVCLKAPMTLGTTLMMHPRDLSCNPLHVFCWFLCLTASTQWPGLPDANTEENGHECTLEPLMSFKLDKVTMQTCTVTIYLVVTSPDVTDGGTLMC